MVLQMFILIDNNNKKIKYVQLYKYFNETHNEYL